MKFRTEVYGGPSPIELISQGKYLTLTPAQQFEVGKKAAEHGIT